MKARPILAAIVGVCCFAGAASAQWVDFTDETNSRLRIRPYVDGSGSQVLDGQEKDIAVADLNKDGWTDVIVVRKAPFSTPGARQDILLMNRSGVLVDMTLRFAPGFLETLTDARDVFIGDFTGDGWPDVVIANTFGQQPRFYRNGGRDLAGRWLGLIDESELRLPFISVPGDVNTLQICAAWGGDVTGNGALDLYLSNYASFGGTHDLLLVNDGAGFFTNETDARLGATANVAFGTSVEIHDMDGDGDNDIVKISSLYSQPPFGIGVYLLFNDGTGQFDTIPFQKIGAFDAPYMFTVSDLAADGGLDLYAVDDGQDRLRISLGGLPDGPVDFASLNVRSPRTASFGGNVKAADIDGDGDLDMGIGPIDVDIANCGDSSEFALLENTGTGLTDNWTLAEPQNFHVDPHDFDFLDINRDGCLDMIMGLCQGWRVFIQSCQ